MKTLRAALVTCLSAILVHAEDFKLSYLGAGLITLHTSVTYEGKGERLIATATNDSGAPITHVKICVVSYAIKDACLFEMWNTEVWQPGVELNWSSLSARKVPYLKHDATIQELDGPKASPPPPAQVVTAGPPPPQPKPAPIEYSAAVRSGGSLVIDDGTPIRMRLTRNLSSAEAQPGDRVDFEVLDDVRVNNTVAIAGGSIAIATITEAEAKRSMGRAGRLDVNLDYVRAVSGDKVRLRGVQDTKAGGHTGAMTGAMVATAVVFWPAAPLFLFMKGKDVKIPKGHEVTVYVNGDQTILGAAPMPQAASSVPVSEKPASKPARIGRPMTNEDVLTLNAAGFGDEFMITKIEASPCSFDVDTPSLLKLKQSGLSDSVIGAMVKAAAARP